MAKSYSSPFQCRDKISGTCTSPCFGLLLQIPPLQDFAGGFINSEDLYMGNSDQEVCRPFLLISIYGYLPKYFPL